MTTEQEKLKPCPFCGGRVKLEEVKMRSGTWYGIKCRNNRNLGGDCAMEQVPSRTPEAAISRWNMRKPEEALHAQLAEAHALLRDIELTMDAQEDSVSLGYDIELRMATILRPSASAEPSAATDTQAVNGRRALGLVALVQNDEIDRLKAENDSLRKDAERYRWLRDDEYLHAWADLHVCDEHRRAEVTDKAIDAAMAKEGR